MSSIPTRRLRSKSTRAPLVEVDINVNTATASRETETGKGRKLKRTRPKVDDQESAQNDEPDQVVKKQAPRTKRARRGRDTPAEDESTTSTTVPAQRSRRRARARPIGESETAAVPASPPAVTSLAASPTSPATLPSFDPYTHLQQAWAGPSPLCLVMDAPPPLGEEPHDEENAENQEKVMAPFFVHFLDEQNREIHPPAGLFDHFPRGSIAANLQRQSLNYLQHLAHACLYRRYFHSPVTYKHLTCYPIRLPLPYDSHHFTALFQARAASVGARLLDLESEWIDGVGEVPLGYYYRFGIYINLEQQQQQQQAGRQHADEEMATTIAAVEGQAEGEDEDAEKEAKSQLKGRRGRKRKQATSSVAESKPTRKRRQPRLSPEERAARRRAAKKQKTIEKLNQPRITDDNKLKRIIVRKKTTAQIAS